MRGGAELQAVRTATTVRLNGGKPVVTDGPFIESKETVGGFAVIEVADLDEAIEWAKSLPRGGSVAVRPGGELPEATYSPTNQSRLSSSIWPPGGSGLLVRSPAAFSSPES